VTGKIERDLSLAKQSIDLLDMLKRKTTGNLSEQEQTMLERLLYELQMNFVEESRKGAGDDSVASEPSEQPEQTPPTEPSEDTDETSKEDR